MASSSGKRRAWAMCRFGAHDVVGIGPICQAGGDCFSLNCVCLSKCWLAFPVDPCVLLHWVRHHGVSYLQSHRSAAMLQRASRYEPNVSFLSPLHSLGLLNVRPGQGFRPKQRDGQGNLMPAKREKRLGVRTLCVPVRRLLSFLLHVDIQAPSCRPTAKPNIPKRPAT